MRLVYVLGMIICFCSCRQENNVTVTVNGNIKNRITNANMSNLTVELYSCEDLPFSVGSCNTISTAVSDANGNFSFQFTKLPGRYYKCRLNETGYYESDAQHNIVTQVDLNSNSTQNIQLKVLPKAYMWFIFNNTSCFDGNDLFVFERSNQIPNFYWGVPFTINGCNSYDNLSYSDFPFGYHYFHWEVTKNSVTQHFYDTLYLNPFQDTVYSINY